MQSEKNGQRWCKVILGVIKHGVEGNLLLYFYYQVTAVVVRDFGRRSTHLLESTTSASPSMLLTVSLGSQGSLIVVLSCVIGMSGNMSTCRHL